MDVASVNVYVFHLFGHVPPCVHNRRIVSNGIGVNSRTKQSTLFVVMDMFQRDAECYEEKNLYKYILCIYVYCNPQRYGGACITVHIYWQHIRFNWYAERRIYELRETADQRIDCSFAFSVAIFRFFSTKDLR